MYLEPNLWSVDILFENYIKRTVKLRKFPLIGSDVSIFFFSKSYHDTDKFQTIFTNVQSSWNRVTISFIAFLHEGTNTIYTLVYTALQRYRLRNKIIFRWKLFFQRTGYE